MPFGNLRKAQSASALRQAPEIEQIVCVAAICALASLPLLFSVALTIWGA
jgi:hypothetical protein